MSPLATSTLVLAMGVVVGQLSPSPPSVRSATAILRAARDASGGDAWAKVHWIEARGRKGSYGLDGTYGETVDFASGHFERTARYSVFGNAEGDNANGRWRQDTSGGVHPLNSGEAITVATTEAYLARRGYFSPNDAAAHTPLSPERESGVVYDRVEVTPKGGRAAVLWIRADDSSVDRIVMQLSERLETIRFSDYRVAGGLRLPFRIDTDHGDEPDTGVATIVSYRVETNGAAPLLHAPAPPNDVTFVSRERSTTIPASVNANGFLIVSATIDGHGPYPFILDTGGHDIITPRFAAQLGLKAVGSGQSYGAGSASTRTAFTKVRSLGIGGASIASQPFTILHLDLGETPDAGGTKVPIAGILGLEVFERFAVGIDFDGHATLTQAGQSPSHAKGAMALSLRFTSDMPLTRASVDARAGCFGVDLGNNVGLILFVHWVDERDIAVGLQNGPQMSGESVGGDVSMRHGRVSSLTLGSASFTDVPVLVAGGKSGSFSARSEAGNIGTAVLARFQRVTFDYAHGMLYVDGK